MNKLKFSCLVLFLIFFKTVLSQGNIDKIPHLQEVYDSIQTIPKEEKSLNVILKLKYKKFDFGHFEPSESYQGSGNYFEVSYGDGKRILIIDYFDNSSVIPVYSLRVFEFTNFIVSALFNSNQEFSITERYRYFTNTFFVYVKNERKNYFINPKPQFGTTATLGGIFEEPFLLADVSDISCIMTLRDDLWPETIFRFHQGRFVFGSHIRYQDDRKTLIGESVFINITEADKVFLQKETKLISAIFLKIENRHRYSFFTKPKINENYNFFPLWNWRGNHLYN